MENQNGYYWVRPFGLHNWYIGLLDSGAWKVFFQDGPRNYEEKNLKIAEFLW